MHFDLNEFLCVCMSNRYGYFGKDKPEVVKLLVCNIMGCLTDGTISLSANGDDKVSYHYRDQDGINMLKTDGVEVSLNLSLLLKCPTPDLNYPHKAIDHPPHKQFLTNFPSCNCGSFSFFI